MAADPSSLESPPSSRMPSHTGPEMSAVDVAAAVALAPAPAGSGQADFPGSTEASDLRALVLALQAEVAALRREQSESRQHLILEMDRRFAAALPAGGPPPDPAPFRYSFRENSPSPTQLSPPGVAGSKDSELLPTAAAAWDTEKQQLQPPHQLEQTVGTESTVERVPLELQGSVWDGAGPYSMDYSITRWP